MKCFNCGKEINDNSKFCCYCGSNLENKKTVNNNKKRKVAIKKEYKILFTLLSIFLLIFVFQLLFSTLNDASSFTLNGAVSAYV